MNCSFFKNQKNLFKNRIVRKHLKAKKLFKDSFYVGK